MGDPLLGARGQVGSFEDPIGTVRRRRSNPGGGPEGSVK